MQVKNRRDPGEINGIPSESRKNLFVPIERHHKGGSIGGMVGSIIGNAIMPGIGGAILGGALGGGLEGSMKGDFGKGLLGGALSGAGSSIVAPMMGSALGGTAVGRALDGTWAGDMMGLGPANGLASSFGGEAINWNPASGGGGILSGLGDLFGGGAADGSAGFNDLIGNLAGGASKYTGSGGGGILSSLGGNPLQTLSTLMNVGQGIHNFGAQQDYLDSLKQQQAAQQAQNAHYGSLLTDFTPLNREYVAPQGDPSKYGEAGGQHLFFNDVNPNTFKFAKGGHVPSPDGNEPRGILDDLANDTVPAMLSPGEYVVPKSAVTKMGSGNNAKGADAMDRMVSGLSKNKRSRKGVAQYAKKRKSIPVYKKRNGVVPKKAVGMA